MFNILSIKFANGKAYYSYNLSTTWVVVGCWSYKEL